MDPTQSSGDYAGMTFGSLALWIAIGTLAGVLSRKLLRAPHTLGHYGDMVIGLLGLFGLGWALRQLDVDLSEYILRWTDNVGVNTAIWIDVAVVAFFGSLLLRLILKPLVDGGKKG